MLESTREIDRHQDDRKLGPLRLMDRDRVGMCELIPVTSVVLDFRLIEAGDDLIDLVDVFFGEENIDDFADISVIDVFFRIVDELKNFVPRPINPRPLFDFPFFGFLRIVDALQGDIQFVDSDLTTISRCKNLNIDFRIPFCKCLFCESRDAA